MNEQRKTSKRYKNRWMKDNKKEEGWEGERGLRMVTDNYCEHGYVQIWVLPCLVRRM